jgi:capsid protein
MAAGEKILSFLGFKPKAEKRVEAEASYYPGNYRNVFSVSYDGEKNLGEIGPIKEYWPDYHALRLRSWQAYLDSEVAQMVIGKYVKWIIGSGLKLQAEPVEMVLSSEKIAFNKTFNDFVEARFGVFAKSNDVDYSGKRNLHKLARIAYKNAILGGDVLVVLRYIDDEIKVQLIDGAHVCSPTYGNDYYGNKLANGNEIRHGIELNARGEHVAYYVKNKDGNFERIPAKSQETGLTVAFLLYGLEYRLDNHRGLPLISAMLETMKKLERYKEATVGSAEEVAKIAWQVVHQIYSTGENPMAERLAKAFDADAVTDDIPEDIQGNKLADKVAATTNKTAVNNPPGAEIKPITVSNKELYFEPFYTVNIGLVCAAINIPKDVAMSQYDSNFSASRAALKDWEHTIVTDRADTPSEFYQNVYNFFLHVEILRNKVQAPGYLAAFVDKNKMVLNAYRNARWVGASVPHIDPLKEVNAERLKLGAAAKDMPLTTLEAATEALNGGDSEHNLNQFADELEQAKSLGIESTIPEAPVKEKEDS